MKTVMVVIGFGLLLVGCGQGPAVVTVKDANSSETTTQAKTKEPIEAEKPLPKDLKSLKALVEKGDAKAQTNLGVMYDKGQGVEQDFKEAVKWWQKASDQRFAIAQYNLGTMYYNGHGVEQNNVTAYAWLNIAVANGDQNAKNGKSVLAKKMTPAQIVEAEELVKEMVKKNPKLVVLPRTGADKPLKVLAEKGDAEAQCNLGAMYYLGQSVEKDFKEAVKWYRKAAEQGYVESQYMLGFIYINGEGVKKDDVTGYAWLNIAAANGKELAKKFKDLMAMDMTPEQIGKAQELSKEMTKKKPKLINK